MLDDLVITIFDVGHGDAILIEFPDHSVGIVDCCTDRTDGTPLNPLLWELQKLDPPRIRFVLLTHPHSDHCRGLSDILDKFGSKIDEFWHTMTDLQEAFLFCSNAGVYCGKDGVPDRPSQSYIDNEVKPVVNTLDRALKMPNTKVRQIRQQQVWSQETDGEFQIEFLSLSPLSDDHRDYNFSIASFLANGEPTQEDPQWSSLANRVSAALVMRVSSGDKAWSIVLAGDLPGNRLRIAAESVRKVNTLKEWLPVDAFKISHHGTADSVYDEMWTEWMDGTGIALVSTKGGRYPSAPYVESLVKLKNVANAEGGVLCYSTGRGAVCNNEDRPNFDRWKIATRLRLPWYGANNKCCRKIQLRLKPDMSVEMNPPGPLPPCPTRP